MVNFGSNIKQNLILRKGGTYLNNCSPISSAKALKFFCLFIFFFESAVTLFTYTMVFLHVHENYEKHLQRTLDQAINELLGLSMSYFLW